MIALFRSPTARMYSAFYYYGHYAAKYGNNPEGFHK
jgi:hypothetical protein